MGVAAAAGVRAPAEGILHVWLVQGIVHLGDGRRRIAKCRVGSDVLNALAVDINLTAILQAFKYSSPVNGRLASARKSSGFIGTSYRKMVVKFMFCFVV